nr:HAD-IIB family hydrolase [uncultured Albidiferax sp.]
MKPLAQWPLAARRGLVGVLTDIDDTLTTDGAITADALQALADLKAAGLVVIAITGRPVGWSEPFARTWPVDAIVAENGAVALQKNTSQIGLLRLPDGREQLSKLYIQDARTRSMNFLRMQEVAQRVLAEVPEAILAQDSAGRETDIAIDHSEFTQLPTDSIAQVVAILQSEGMHATVSSIHINGWFGGHDKWVGACWIVQAMLGRNLAAERELWAYVGDSTNDQCMFEALPHSIGVANVRRFEAQMACKPQYITSKERGAGFAEAAFALLAAR